MPDNSLTFSLRARRGDLALDAHGGAPRGRVTGLFGPSGTGKTSLLRLMAGFDRPDSGHVRFAGQAWVDTSARVWLPPHKRPAGFVFQESRLFPHLDVAGNLDFAHQRASRTPDASDLQALIDALDLGALLSRRTDSLSGGERQRVAIARALACRPGLLLLDEPVRALDGRRKAATLDALRSLVGRMGMTAIFVSHSVEEIVRMADEVIIMTEGHTAPCRSVEASMDAMEAVSGTRFGPGAVLRARLASHDETYRLARLEAGDITLALPGFEDVEAGNDIQLRIRARDVSIALHAPSGSSIRNCLPAKIISIDAPPDSAYADIGLLCGRTPLKSRITRAAADELGLAPGMDVLALVKSASLDRRIL